MNAARLAPLRSILVALSLAVLGAGAVATVAPIRPAAAQGDPRVEARTRYMAGKAKFDAADYRGAIGDFTAADQLAPSAMNDYNIALAYERLGEPASAVRYYRSYLNRQPTAANRAEVEASLARLDAAAKETDRLSAEDAARAEAARREEAIRADEARKAEEMRRLAEQGGGTGPAGPVGPSPTSYGATGDAELDRVAAVDLNTMRGTAPLPPPRNAGGAGGAGAAGAGGAGDVPPKKNKSIFKNPVFWVVVGVGLYAIIVLSDDSSSSGNGLMAPLPMGPSPGPAGNGGVLMRF